MLIAVLMLSVLTLAEELGITSMMPWEAWFDDGTTADAIEDLADIYPD